jgi:hypothetical protein
MSTHSIYHHIADDHSRGLLVQHAIRRGIEQARGDFYHALLVDGLDDEGLNLVADEAWNVYHRQVEFDYPQYAETLYVYAFRVAYRRHLENVAQGEPTDPVALARAIEVDLGLTAE